MSRANYKEITQWFSLDKYDYILGLSVRHSMAEVFMMNYRYERLEYEKEDEFLAIPFPMIPDINSFDEEVGDGQLSYDGRGIIPINFGLLCETVNSFISDGRIKVLPSGQIVPADGMGGKDIYYQPMRYEYDDPTSDGLTGILTDIGLDIMNDDEILASLKVLLKKWRNQTGIEEPKENDRRRFGGSTIAKIYNYRVLAYFDIARWSRINNKTVSNELYARLLFPTPMPNGDIKGGSHVRDSVRPFADNVRDLLNTVSVKKYFANNPHIENMRFSEFLKLADFQ